MRIPEFISHHCAGRVDVSQALIPGSISTYVCWCVCHGAAHVLPGSYDVALPMQSAVVSGTSISWYLSGS